MINEAFVLEPKAYRVICSHIEKLVGGYLGIEGYRLALSMNEITPDNDTWHKWGEIKFTEIWPAIKNRTPYPSFKPDFKDSVKVTGLTQEWELDLTLCILCDQGKVPEGTIIIEVDQ